MIPLVDAHLDLAYNARAHGWDLTLPLDELRRRVRGPYRPTVTLPALAEAGVVVAFATLFVDPAAFPSPAAARDEARFQLDYYENLFARGLARPVRSQAELKAHLERWERDRVPGLVLLMEGAEPLRTPDEVQDWHAHGLRLLGPAWKDTRYAGGTGGKKGLTDLGRALLLAMAELGMGLDLAHLAEAAFFEALAIYPGPVLVSHANPRALAHDTNRHLADAQLGALKPRDAVVGLVLYNRFLDPGWRPGQHLPLARVAEHAHHLAQHLGWARVGIGSDFDGSFGAEAIPEGLDAPKDLRKLAPLLGDAAPGVLGENWLSWLFRNLPA